MACAYSPEHYGQIIDKARDGGYRFVTVSDVGDAVPDGRIFLVRHDIDITVTAAHRMALLEYDRGIRTCYYVRLHAPYYNPFEPETLKLLIEMADMGHELGLHYEPRHFEAFHRDVAEGIRGDLAAFEHALGRKTKSVSQHEPAVGPVVNALPEGYPCAYQRHLVVDMPYFGDSGFHWREGCVCEKLGRLDKIHTLIHPASWMRAPIGWEDVLRSHAEEAGERLRTAMERHIVSQHEYLAQRERLDVERRARYDDS